MDQTAEIADLKRPFSESETRHRLLIGGWAQAEWETEADVDVVDVVDSPSWRAYTGQTGDEWLGEGWLDAIHPDDRAFAERQWREAMAARRVVDAESCRCGSLLCARPFGDHLRAYPHSEVLTACDRRS